MTLAEAREEIEVFTLAGNFPSLSVAEVDLLLRKAKRASQPLVPAILTGSPTNNNLEIVRREPTVPPDTHGEWTAATVYAVGATVVPVPRNGHFYTATVGGTSGATQPTFPTESGDTVGDNGVTWEESGAALWVPTFALAPAIAAGWKLKAGKVAAHYDYSSDDQRLTRSQIFKACMEQYAAWRRLANESVDLLGSLRSRRSGSVPSANDDRLWCDCDDGDLSGPGRGIAVPNVGGGRTIWSDVY